MLTICLIAQGLFLLASLIVSARLTIRMKSAIRGGPCLYGLLVLGTVLFFTRVDVDGLCGVE